MITKVAANSDQKVSYPLPKKIIMYPTPGYKFQVNISGVTPSPIRQLYVINQTLFVICGSGFYSFTPAGVNNTNLATGVFTLLGTLNTSIGWCSIVCNTAQIVISDGQFGYTYTLSSGAFAQIVTSGGFPTTGVTNFTYFDSYVLGAQTNSKTVWQSNVLDATTWNALAFDTIVSFSDNIVGVFSDELQLYVFGPKICEVQADAGQIPYAFQKVPNVLIQAGCAAVATICKIGNTVAFLASDIAGKSYVAVLEGYGTKVISSPPMNEAMERYSTVSDAFGYVYREADNMFYVITFPTAGVTWAYDIKTDLWHKRSIGGGVDLPTCCVLWQGKQIVGDATGNLHIMSQNYTTYSTYNNKTGIVTDTPLERTRTAAHVNAEGKTLFISELWVDIQSGGGFVSDPNLVPQPYMGNNFPLVLQQATSFSISPVTVNINNTTASSLIAVFIATESAESVVTSITDSAGQVYTQAPNAQGTDPIGGNATDIWYCPNSVAGVTSVTATVTFSNPQETVVEVFEVSNIQITNPLDASASISNGAANTVFATPPITTTGPAFILTGFDTADDIASTVNPPYTLDSLNNLAAFFSSTDAVNDQSTLFTALEGISDTYCASAAAFLATNYPVAPLATLFVSKDFGNTWITVGTRSMGATGKYQKRLIWRNLGRFRQNATFKLTITDSVACFILGAKAVIKTGIK